MRDVLGVARSVTCVGLANFASIAASGLIAGWKSPPSPVPLRPKTRPKPVSTFVPLPADAA